MVPSWTQQELADAIGIPRSRVANWETERNFPKKPDLVKAATVLGRPVEWFYKPGHPKDEPKSVSPFTSPAPLAVDDELIELPYAGLVPASGFDAELEQSEPIAVPPRFGRRHRHLRYACRVQGPSCRPYIEQGDVVIFERDLAPPSGVFVLAQRKGDHFATLKLYQSDENGFPVLHATNPESEDPLDGVGWGVIARLVGVWRDRGVKETVWHEDAGLTRRDLE